MTTHPRREVVAHPDTLAALERRALPTPSVARDGEEYDELTVVLLRTLMRAQLGLAFRVVLFFACLLGGLLLLVAAVRSLRTATLAGVPLEWLLLGVAIYPLFVAAAWLYVRVAERNEADYDELLAAATAPTRPHPRRVAPGAGDR